MGEWTGKIVSCDKCGREIHCKLIDQTEANGGFIRMDRYAELPKTWKYRYEVGYLCPDCNAEYESLISAFIGEGADDE